MPANLDQIIAATRQRLSKKRRAADVRAWERQAVAHVPRGFRRRLAAVAATGVAVIALEGGKLLVNSGEVPTLIAEPGAGEGVTQDARDALR